MPDDDQENATVQAGPVTGRECVECGAVLHNQTAGLCHACGSHQGMRCGVCHKRLPARTSAKARRLKCTECGSHQTRARRAIGLGNTTLALLTALFAVAGVAIPHLYRFLWPLDLDYLGLTEDRKDIMVGVVNRDPYPMYVRNVRLTGTCLGREGQRLSLYDRKTGSFMQPESLWLPPGTTVLFLRPKTLALSDDTPPCPSLSLHFELSRSKPRKISEIVDEGFEGFLAFWSGLRGDP